MDIFIKSYFAPAQTLLYYHYRDGICIRQIDFEPNRTSIYTSEKPVDKYGFMTDQMWLPEPDEIIDDEITEDEFEAAWKKALADQQQ